MSRYCKLEIIEVADEKTPDHASAVVENTIRDKEAERIMKYVKEDTYVITLEINGKLLSSEELSAKINQLGIQGTSHITFIIGGSIGLAKSARKIGLCIKLFQDDLSTPVDAGHSVRADIQKLSDHQR